MVTAVQSSSRRRTSGPPALTIGSTVNTTPGCSRRPVSGAPKCSSWGSSWKSRPMPWPQYSRTIE